MNYRFHTADNPYKGGIMAQPFPPIIIGYLAELSTGTIDWGNEEGLAKKRLKLAARLIHQEKYNNESETTYWFQDTVR
jgi:hypothetical protein